MSRSRGLGLAEPAERYGLPALRAAFPGLTPGQIAEDPHFERGDRLCVLGHLGFETPELEDRPSLTWTYELKLIVPRSFPCDLPRVYSIDGQVPREYHTNPNGDLCLGPPLQLQEILREDPTLLGYVMGAVVPYLYRHRFTVLFPGREPPTWGELEHGTPGLLGYYERRLGACGYAACLALLRHGGMKQRTGRRSPCPCGSGRSLNACHYSRMADVRQSAGRAAVWRAYLELRDQGPPRRQPAHTESEGPAT